jgi:hypothetical protein
VHHSESTLLTSFLYRDNQKQRHYALALLHGVHHYWQQLPQQLDEPSSLGVFSTMVTERAQQRYDDKRQHRATRCNVSKAVPLPGGTVDNHRHHANRDTQRKGIQYDFRDADRTLRNNRQSVASKRN